MPYNRYAGALPYQTDDDGKHVIQIQRGMKTDISFIIHELRKEQNTLTTERLREKAIIPAADESSFVDEVTDLFKRHQSGRLFGEFESDAVAFPFPALLRTYVEDGDFLGFSKKAAHLLASQMNKIPAATGGFFFAVRFIEDGHDILLICMLSQKQGQAVDAATLSLTKSISLQMEQLDLTAQINLTDWKNSKPEPVSLIRGRKKVSNYFRDFIGLHEPRSNTEATKKFRDLADEWMEERAFEQENREKVRQDIIVYSKKRGTEPLELDSLARLVDPEQHEAFFERANAQGLSAEFHLDHRSLKKWERVVYSEKGGGIRLNFAKRLLNNRVRYNAEKKTLTIREIELRSEDLQ